MPRLLAAVLRTAPMFVFVLSSTFSALAQESASVLDVEADDGTLLLQLRDDGRLRLPAGAADGYVLTTESDGTARWAPAPSAGSGLKLPYTGMAATSGVTPLFTLIQQDGGTAARFEIDNASNPYAPVYIKTNGSGAGLRILNSGTGSGLRVAGAGEDGIVVEDAGRYGVFATTASTLGRSIFGQADGTRGSGVYGIASGSGGAGVRGEARYGSGLDYGVLGSSTSTTGRGVYGTAPMYGVVGYASGHAGNTYGVYGSTSSDAGFGGYFTGGRGLYASRVTTTTAAHTYSGYIAGLSGLFAANVAQFNPDIAFNPDLTLGSGEGIVYARESDLWLASTDDVVVQLDQDRNGTTSAFRVRGRNASGSPLRLFDVDEAGDAYIDGALQVQGGLRVFNGVDISFSNLNVGGNLNVTGTKNFRIDHPLDPANKYLYHFALESHEVLNVYSGNVTTDGAGYATVTLPEWFEAVNTDYRYQLTVVGTFARAIIAEEIQGNRFTIRTDAPSVKVSWQVTAVRNDPGLRTRPHPVEAEKPAAERGTYLAPAAYGQSHR